jgi:hypothetical protein
MRPFVEDVLGDGARVAEVLDMARIRAYREAFYAGAAASCYRVWTLFVLELWLREREGCWLL